ncbi:hypothetical protein QBC39DRAFT_166862 [Podospora conica]|nr:hypothetical protein QBC39DRAFT_166862 [Schizothecium conicum]
MVGVWEHVNPDSSVPDLSQPTRALIREALITEGADPPDADDVKKELEMAFFRASSSHGPVGLTDQPAPGDLEVGGENHKPQPAQVYHGGFVHAACGGPRWNSRFHGGSRPTNRRGHRSGWYRGCLHTQLAPGGRQAKALFTYFPVGGLGVGSLATAGRLARWNDVLMVVVMGMMDGDAGMTDEDDVWGWWTGMTDGDDRRGRRMG